MGVKTSPIKLPVNRKDSKVNISTDSVSSKTIDVSNQDLSEYADSYVNYDIPYPRDYAKFIPCPHVMNGFGNSCSEASAEVVMRYWKIIDWNQFTMHKRGFLTFEGNIAEGDLGLINMFRFKEFYNEDGKRVKFIIHEYSYCSIEDLKKWIDYGIPVIVRIFTDIYKRNQHTQVLLGYNSSGVFLNDNDVFNGSKNSHHWIYESYEKFDKGYSTKAIVVFPKEYNSIPERLKREPI